ncbi:MAG: CHASE2 domain-containing protein, partial [Proteobacteria bacterium]
MKSPNEKRALKRKPRLSQFTSLTISTYALGLVVTFLVVYTAIDFYRHPNEIEKGSLRSYVRSAHEKTIDLRLLDRGPAQGSNQIAILAIDDETLRLEGRWPWPREKTARLIDRTLMYGAKSVSFDMVFSEPDNNSALPAVSRLEKVLRDSKLKNKTLSDALSEEVSKADADKVFATTIRAHQDSLVMGSFYMHEMSGGKASDLCLDAYYSRTYPSRYWKKEALPFSVVDGPLSQLNYPRNLEDHLNGYFT